MRGAWIEIVQLSVFQTPTMSHPVRGAWIEILDIGGAVNGVLKSHPVRGAWIEIMESNMKLLFMTVAPREGCVD